MPLLAAFLACEGYKGARGVSAEQWLNGGTNAEQTIGDTRTLGAGESEPSAACGGGPGQWGNLAFPRGSGESEPSAACGGESEAADQ